MQSYENNFLNKKIAITGCVGTVGSELIRLSLKLGAKEVRGLDNSETGLFFLEREIDDDRLGAYVADIQNKNHMKKFFTDIDLVFHCAAYKHVPSCSFGG